jgi:Gas vesicle synthesis protein GvpL/GvpF
MSALADTPTYVYGVMSAETSPPQLAGINGAPLQSVTSHGITALVSGLDDQELALGRQEITLHERILEETLTHGTVLPMRFGVVMEGDSAVKDRLLDAHHAELERQLREMTGKVELRVRAVYEERTLMREVVEENPAIARLRDSLRSLPEDATYYARVQLGEMVADAVVRKRNAEADRMLGSLSPLATAVNAPEPPNERIVINASFLTDQ